MPGFLLAIRWLQRWTAHAWTLPTLVFVLVAAGTLGPSTFFLHFDSPLQHVIAADFISACWGTGTSKPAVALLLAVPYALSGINQHWETVLLVMSGGVTVSVLFKLTFDVTQSKQWALLGTLWFISLPTILYYTRIHMGYPLATFLLGIWLYSHERYGWAGLLFGLTLPLHVGFIIPLAAWVGSSVIFGVGSRKTHSLLRMGICAALPILALEGVYFAYNGQILRWTRNIYNDTVRIDATFRGEGGWLDVWHIVRFSNGPVNALLLLTGLGYLYVRKPRNPSADTVFLAGWLVAGFYVVYTGWSHANLRPRMLTGAYPLLAVTSTFTVMRLARRLHELFRPPMKMGLDMTARALVALALPWTLVNHALDAAAGSQTAFAEVDRVMARAAQADFPVRYFGNHSVGRFFARKYAVELVTNETDVDIITSDTRSVWIFEGDFRGLPSIWGELQVDTRVNPSGYRITDYPHLRRYRPYIVDEVTATSTDIRTWERLSYIRAPDATQSIIEIWWPLEPAGVFQPRHVVYQGSSSFILYYPGTGCVSPKHFTNGTRNYYELVFDRVREIGQAAAGGNLAKARSILETALKDGVGVAQ